MWMMGFGPPVGEALLGLLRPAPNGREGVPMGLPLAPVGVNISELGRELGLELGGVPPPAPPPVPDRGRDDGRPGGVKVQGQTRALLIASTHTPPLPSTRSPPPPYPNPDPQS
jgi:hypothetical protein